MPTSVAIIQKQLLQFAVSSSPKQSFSDIVAGHSVALADYQYSENSSVLHLSAANGNVEAFYTFAVHETNLQRDRNDKLNKLFTNAKEEVPWHIAAKYGHTGFFEAPESEANKLYWDCYKQLLKTYRDIHGNTVLHAAVLYDENMSKLTRKNKKKIIRLLLADDENKGLLKAVNNDGKTALQVAAEHGCYETCRELLQIDNINLLHADNAGDTAELLATAKEHERVKQLLQQHQNNDLATTPVALKRLQISAGVNLENHDDFTESLKKIEATVSADDIKSAIHLRIEALHKKNRWYSIARAMALAICPAIAAAGLAGMVGVAIPLPFSGPIAFVATFITCYSLYSYSTYKSLRSEHDKRLQERFYLEWVSGKLQALEKERVMLKERLDRNPASEEVARLQTQYDQLMQKAKNYYDFEPARGVQPKLTLSVLPQDYISTVKKTVANDPAKVTRYAEKKGYGIPAVNYFIEGLCALGGITELLEYVGFVGKVALIGGGLLGAAFAPLAGIVVAGLIIGGILYKSTYEREKEKAGIKNRDLILAHDACKNSFNATACRAMRARLEQLKTPNAPMVASTVMASTGSSLAPGLAPSEPGKAQAVSMSASSPVTDKQPTRWFGCW